MNDDSIYIQCDPKIIEEGVKYYKAIHRNNLTSNTFSLKNIAALLDSYKLQMWATVICEGRIKICIWFDPEINEVYDIVTEIDYAIYGIVPANIIWQVEYMGDN